MSLTPPDPAPLTLDQRMLSIPPLAQIAGIKRRLGQLRVNPNAAAPRLSPLGCLPALSTRAWCV